MNSRQRASTDFLPDGSASNDLNSDVLNSGESTSANDELATLRGLLFQAQQKQIIDLQQELENLTERVADKQLRIDDACDVLVPAINKKLSLDDQLGDALNPVVVSQFHRSARQEPDDMADALYPILGPAIRKMIASMLTPDPKARKRRYRVEQLFLIKSESGLPICHAIGDSVRAHDADMVSGMLSAIQSFVHEAFSANEFDSLDTLQVGELSVLIEWGPEGVLAAVIRGVVPKKLRESMQLLLENIHQQYATELINYEGDSSAFDPLKPELRDFLGNHDGTLKNVVKQLSTTAKCWLAGVVLAMVGLIVWFSYDTYDSMRWNNYVQRVSNEPGIVVVDTRRHSGNYYLSVLKDPLARDPSQFLVDSGIKRQSVDYQIKPYQSLHPDFALGRLKALLEPPPHVRLYLAGTTLQVFGAVDQNWKSDATRIARAVSGVVEVIFTSE